MCTKADCNCATKQQVTECVFAGGKLKCKWQNKACSEIDCKHDPTKTAICWKKGVATDRNTKGKYILSVVKATQSEAACAGKITCTPSAPQTSDDSKSNGKESQSEGATTVGNSVPASKDGDTNSEDPAGA